MSKLDGQVAIVTGAGRGLGRAYALRLAGLGAKVAVVDRDLKSFEEFEGERQLMTADGTVEEIVQAGGEALGVELDVGDQETVRAMVGRVLGDWGGRIDILVNNAGGGSKLPATTLASELDPADLDEILRRNLYGTVHCCTAVAPTMKSQGSGRIVNVSSIGGTYAREDGGYAHYASAKAGIVMYTRNLAQDMGKHGVNVNCIAPGFIGTGRIVEKLSGSRLPGNQAALGRIGTPEDCAKVVEFLVTDLSDYVTGAVIPVDGGWARGTS